MKKKMTKIAFEEQYSDGSGIESAVRYDEHSVDKEIEIENVSDTVSFPLRKITWLIECLIRIREERGCQ